MTSGLQIASLLLNQKDLTFTGVPCSLLKPITDPLFYDQNSRYLIAANEGDAVAIASGFYLGGRQGIVTMQNSGLGNAVNPLTSLNSTYGIPIGILISMRGSFGNFHDEPQHEHMGSITKNLLELLKIDVLYGNKNLSEEFEQWCSSLKFSLNSTAFLIFRDQLTIDKTRNYETSTALVSRHKLTSGVMNNTVSTIEKSKITRAELIEFIVDLVSEEDIIISTTGYTSRELNTIQDRKLNFYMVGSMGCASSVGLGIALASDRRVVILDGDGAALMRMGALSTIGLVNPNNLIHVLIDNGIHESTGSQPTATTRTNLGEVALACGYEHVIRATSSSELKEQFVLPTLGSKFIHFIVRPGSLRNLPRPTISPQDNALRFRENMLIN